MSGEWIVFLVVVAGGVGTLAFGLWCGYRYGLEKGKLQGATELAMYQTWCEENPRASQALRDLVRESIQKGDAFTLSLPPEKDPPEN